MQLCKHTNSLQHHNTQSRRGLGQQHQGQLRNNVADVARDLTGVISVQQEMQFVTNATERDTSVPSASPEQCQQ